MTKLTPEQVEKLEAAAEKAEDRTTFPSEYAPFETQTILTLCREWREMRRVLDRLDNLPDSFCMPPKGGSSPQRSRP